MTRPESLRDSETPPVVIGQGDQQRSWPDDSTVGSQFAVLSQGAADVAGTFIKYFIASGIFIIIAIVLSEAL